jgi:outer membrane protein assembly factor BamA
MKRHQTSVLFLLLMHAAAAGAQTPATGTRADEIESEQRAKAQKLSPDLAGKAEHRFAQAQKLVERLFGVTGGFRPLIGNMVTGSGFAAGVEYYRPDLDDGNILFRTSARASIWKYERLDGEVSAPHLLSDHAFVDFLGVYRNYPSLNYYGPGPNSAKTGRSDFRLESSSFDFSAGVKPGRYLRMGITGGYLRVNVGPGTADEFASTEQIYTEAQAPGILHQSDFLRGGPFIQFDYRDHPLDPHRGGNYVASYIYYDDLRLNTGNHRKLYAEAQQYIPFFNEKRVIALRAKTELSYRNTNQVIPFYLQPVLGGSDDLRGFRPFRFYDNNLFVMNAEYRWEVMSGFDMAVFGDAGKVFHRHADFGMDDLETSAGFGLRFKTRDAVVMRWDVGFSREGFQVWIKFGNVF